MTASERRQYPRVREKLECRLAAASSGAFSARTDDLSCGGASCLIDRAVPPMTKLSVVIDLPSHPVRCTGVVLRQSKADASGGYQTALYFSDLQGSDRKRIADFVLQSMFRHHHKEN